MQSVSAVLGRQAFLDVDPVEPKQMATSGRSSERSRLHGAKMEAIMQALTGLAEVRVAAVTERALLAYSRELVEYDEADLRMALRRMGTHPRDAYQTAFPPLADVIVAVKQAHRDRTAPPKFKPCGQCIEGMVFVDAEGNPCDVTESPKRAMATCACKREWRARWQAAA